MAFSPYGSETSHTHIQRNKHENKKGQITVMSQKSENKSNSSNTNVIFQRLFHNENILGHSLNV